MTGDLRVMHAISDRGIGGAGRYLMAHLESAPPGLEPAVACPAGRLAETLAARGVQLLLLPQGGSSWNWADFRAILQHCREWRPHIVHAHASLAGRVAGRLLGCAVVATRHWTRWEGGGAARLPRPVRTILYGRPSHPWIAASEAARQVLAAEGIPWKAIEVIPTGVDEKRIARETAAANPGVLRRRLGLSREMLAGSVGRLAPEKGHRVLVEAAALLARKGIDLEVLLVGTGPEEENLRRQAAGLGVSLHPAGFQEDVIPFLAAMDLFVLPSYTENMPLALLEAMAAGRPVVASAVGGITEVIRGEEEGILVPPGDPEALAGALAMLIGDPVRRARMSEAGRARIEKSFRQDEMARRTAELYRTLACRRGWDGAASPADAAGGEDGSR